jgi:hypothetical protein
MNNLLTAIYGKTSGSALSTYVGGRIYLDEVRQDIALPYVVFFIVSGMPDKTFTEHYTDTMIQFSLFSDDESGAEIQTMYANLKTLFDECALTITGSTLVWMRESNLTTMVEDGVKHWAIDYELLTSLN